jgi:hypothetical protein
MQYIGSSSAGNNKIIIPKYFFLTSISSMTVAEERCEADVFETTEAILVKKAKIATSSARNIPCYVSRFTMLPSLMTQSSERQSKERHF